MKTAASRLIDVHPLSPIEAESGLRVVAQVEIGRHEPAPGVLESVHIAILEGRNNVRSSRVLLAHTTRARRAVHTVRSSNLTTLLVHLCAAAEAIDEDRRAHASSIAPSRDAVWTALRLPRVLLELAEENDEPIERVVRRAAEALLDRERSST